jgi:hypothetical protein
MANANVLRLQFVLEIAPFCLRPISSNFKRERTRIWTRASGASAFRGSEDTVNFAVWQQPPIDMRGFQPFFYLVSLVNCKIPRIPFTKTYNNQKGIWWGLQESLIRIQRLVHLTDSLPSRY